MTNKKELQLREDEESKKLDIIYSDFAKLCGSNSKEFGMMIKKQLSEGSNPKMSFLSIIENINALNPKDHIEGMLAAQMITTHNMIMQCFRRTVGMFDDGQFDVLKIGNDTLNLANKLMRTYTMQMEALNRYRGKGQQKMTVEHVHINSGGQAIIGNVTKNDTSTEGGTRG